MNTITVYVAFDFGAFVYIGITLKDGETIKEGLKRKDPSIVGYIENGKNIKPFGAFL